MLWWDWTFMALRYIDLETNDKWIVRVASFSSLWWQRRQPMWLFSTKCCGGSTWFHGGWYLVVLWLWEKSRSSNPEKGVRIWQLPNLIRSIPKSTRTMRTMLLFFNDRRVAPCSASCRDTNKPVPTRDHDGAIKRRRNARNVMRLKRRRAVMTTHHENFW